MYVFFPLNINAPHFIPVGGRICTKIGFANCQNMLTKEKKKKKSLFKEALHICILWKLNGAKSL